MHLRTQVWLPLPRERVFAFFAEAANLQSLTPAWLHFEILTPQPVPMRRDTVIDYRIRLHGIPMSWRTHISVWDPPAGFVDTQIKGPYTKWVHTHRFLEVEGGTLVVDTVEFEMWGGPLVSWFVARDLHRIFSYRHDALRQALHLPSGSTRPLVEITRTPPPAEGSTEPDVG